MNSNMARKAKVKSKAVSDFQRHLLIGAGFGLYFGWFFRPQREPSFIFAFFLAFIVTIVMFLFRLYQKGREDAGASLRETPINFAQYFIILAALEIRHFVYDFGSTLMENPVLGGRTASAIFMIFVGVGMGYLYWWKTKKNAS